MSTSAIDQTVTADNNPALAPFDITDYRGVHGENFYENDTLLKYIIQKYAGDYDGTHLKDMQEHLSGYGELAGGILNELVEAAHKEDKYGDFVKYDRTGQRIDEVRYCHEQKEVRRINYEYGIVNLDFHKNWNRDFTMLHRYALGYLANQNGEGGITCPLAMTEGMIRVLKALGTDEQKERYLPMVAGEGSDSHFMCGQYVTERVGGSNVAQNRTVAHKRPDGKWVLTGEKWFCSNPGDLWVTTARVEGTHTIGMFLVPRVKPNGELNGCHIIRKKDIIGSRGKITVETVYEDLEAEELGRVGHGLANLIKYVIKTSRLHVSVAATGMSRRAYIEARAYVRQREAYNRKVAQFPSVLRQLAEMHILHSSITWSIFKNYVLTESNHAAGEVLTPLLKYISTVHSTWITHEAMMLHGGNGILGDFSCLPRLHNDAIINETWEGTHQIIGEHTLKAYARPRIRAAFLELVEQNLRGATDRSELSQPLAFAQEKLNLLRDLRGTGGVYGEVNRSALCDGLYDLFVVSEWIAESVAGNEMATLFARGHAEIVRRGRSGITDPEGIFNDVDILRRIVDY